MKVNFYKKITEITQKDPRYKTDAYEFMMQALWFTQKKLKRPAHVSAKELLEGARDFGLNQYGPMTKNVFEHWGIKSTDDFGEIIFNMIGHGLMKKSDQDFREDFKNVYSFEEALNVFGAKRT